MRASTRSSLTIGIVACVLLLAWAQDLRAQDSEDGYSLYLEIIEGPDPIPQVRGWRMLEQIYGEILNGMGTNREDGRPDIAFDPVSTWPVVVWAYDTGFDYDIAFAEWLGQRWNSVRFLASTPVEELDPRAHVDADRRVYVVWWEDGPVERTMLSIREPGSENWSEPEPIADSARRPAVAFFEGMLLLAHERDAAGGGQEVVVLRRMPDGSSVVDVVAATERTDPLDVELHTHNGRLWMEWKHTDASFAFSELVGGAWVAPASNPWTDPSWFGEEQVRSEIGDALMAP